MFDSEQFIEGVTLPADLVRLALDMGERLRGLSPRDASQALAFAALAATQQDSGDGQFDWQYRDTVNTLGVLAGAGAFVTKTSAN